jgi:hypothetical protein
MSAPALAPTREPMREPTEQPVYTKRRWCLLPDIEETVKGDGTAMAEAAGSLIAPTDRRVSTTVRG